MEVRHGVMGRIHFLSHSTKKMIMLNHINILCLLPVSFFMMTTTMPTYYHFLLGLVMGLYAT